MDMAWVAAIKDLGFPAIVALVLLYVVVIKIEEMKKSQEELKDMIKDQAQAMVDLRLEIVRLIPARRSTDREGG